MKRVEHIWDRMLRAGTLISTVGFTGTVLLQIFARFFLEQAPAWTEEASRLFFVYAMAFAAGLAFKDGEYVQLDVLFNALSKTWQRIIYICSSFLAFVLFGTLTYFSVPFIQFGSLETSPSMEIAMSIPFGSMLVMGTGVCFYMLYLFFYSDNR